MLARMIFPAVILVFLLNISGCEQESRANLSQKNQFLAYCDVLIQKPDEMQACPECLEKITKIFGNEIRRDPLRFTEFYDSILPLMVKSVPGAAIQWEEYANESVRAEMARLKLESNIENLLKKEKEISGLQKKIAELQGTLEEQKKVIADIQKLMDIKDRKVPVLLVNTWSVSNCIFVISKKTAGTQEEVYYTLGDSDVNFLSTKEILLSPGDYKAKIYTETGRGIGRAESETMFSLEPETEEVDKCSYHTYKRTISNQWTINGHYHAVVESL